MMDDAHGSCRMAVGDIYVTGVSTQLDPDVNAFNDVEIGWRE